jgi:hypothetical protein
MASSEQQFLTTFTQSASLSGANNLVAATGLPWELIMGEWSLMLATDDLPGFSPGNPRLRMPSWNLRAVFAQLHNEFPGKFQKPYPLTPHEVHFGDFLFPVSTLVSGGFSVFELSGVQTGSQVIELLGLLGGPPNASLRMAVVRVE